jgi:DNA replication ATP-dependent helicase Dna2
MMILGMPGTGKTTTLVYLIMTLVSMKKTVLLTAYTHSAVDNVLLKLLDKDVDFLRVGTLSKMHPRIRKKYAEERENVNSVADLTRLYTSKYLVATTALGIGQYTC